MTYRENDIDNFLGSLRNIPINVTLENVHQLINNPVTVARLPETNSFFTLKIIVMTTIIGAIITLSVLWPFSEEKAENHVMDNFELPKREEIVADQQEIQKKESNKPTQHLEGQTYPTEPAKTTVRKTERGAEEIAVSNDPERNISNQVTSECIWPADTVLDGRKLMVSLTLAELEKLGFLVVRNEKDQSGLFYHNEFNGIVSAMHKVTHLLEEGGRAGSASTPSNQIAEANIKKVASSNDYYPLCESDFTMDPISSPLLGNDWNKTRDTLVPVVLNKEILPELLDGTRTLWFRASKTFFSALPVRYSYMKEVFACIKSLGNTTGRTDIINYEQLKIIDSVNVLELPKEVMLDIGFEFREDVIVFTQNESKVCRVELKMGKVDGVRLGPSKQDLEPTPYQVVFLSNIEGRQGVKWVCSSDPNRNKFDPQYFLENYNLLIPVVLRKKRFPILYEDTYLWFRPTEEFLQIIPGDEGNLIRQEYKYLVSENKEAMESSCGFFEACRSTLHIHDLKLFPNPTSGEVSIKFTLPGEEKVNISLADMNGAEIKKLKENEILIEGTHELKFDVSEFPSGMYLFVIHGKNGFTSKRLLVQK